MIVSTVIEELARHGSFASTTSGTSMEPLFRTGRDMVVIERPTRELRRNDVVLYRYSSGKYVLHRILRFDGDVCIIRGDNTFVLERIPRDMILGVLVRFNRKGRSHSVTDRSYRAYVVFWRLIYPFRYLWYRFRRLAGGAYRRIFKRKK